MSGTAILIAGFLVMLVGFVGMLIAAVAEHVRLAVAGFLVLAIGLTAVAVGAEREKHDDTITNARLAAECRNAGNLWLPAGDHDRLGRCIVVPKR